MKKRKGVGCLVLTTLLFGTTVTTPLISVPIYAQESRIAPTNQYSVDQVTTITNGSGAINASEDVANYANLDEFTLNGTFSFTSNSNSGVNAIFFIGDNTTANNYFTLYAIPSSKRLGVELRNISGNQMLSNSYVTLNDVDFTMEHKVTFTMSKNNYFRIYLDGKKVLEGNAPSGFTNGVIDNPNYMGFGVGSRASGNNYPMTGNLKNLELYNSALSESEIMSYHLGALESIAYKYENIYYQDSNVQRVQDNENISKLVSMDSGSISIRYKVNDQSLGRMSLFSISDNRSENKYIDLYVDPSNNIFGLDVEGTKDFVMPTASLNRANRTVKDTSWHTITITKENGNAKGFMFYLDGAYVDKYTSAVPEGFFSLLADANAVNFGFIDTSGDDLESLTGAIDYVKAYNEILDASTILQEHTLTNWQPGQEIDMTNAIKTENEDLYYAGYENSSSYRIPSLLKTSKGTLLAAIDKRITGAQDCGNIDIAVRRREANQENFGDPIIINDLISNPNNPSSSAFLIDSSMVEDKETGRIFLLADMFLESSGLMDTSQLTTGTGYKEIDGVDYLQLFDQAGNEYTVRPEDGFGYVYDSQNNKTGYTVILESDAPYHERGSLYLNGEYKGNIYMLKNGPEKGELHVLNTQYLWLYYSDDDGKTWSNPIDITPQVKADWMIFLGTGPGVGIQMEDGTLGFPVYSANKNVGGSQSSAMIISNDGGKTWQLGDSPQTNMGNDRETMNNSGKMFTESQAVQLNNGQVKLFMRNTYANKVYVATSSDNGLTWDKVEQIDINEVYCQLSVTNFTRDGKEYVVMTNPDHSPRTQGMVHIGEVDQATGDITWLDSQILNTGKFLYSCLSVLQNDDEDVRFGLLYEDDTDGTFRIKYTEFNDDFIYAGTKTEELKDPKLVDYNVSFDTDKINVALTFDQELLAIGNPQLKLSVGNQEIIADYKEGSSSDTIIFEATLPKQINGVMKAVEVLETNGIIENIKNGKIATLNTNIYDFTEITSGVTVSSYTSQHSSSTAENTDGAAVNVIDGNINTYWHSTWGNANINLPQSVTLKLDETKTLYKLAYTPRQNSNNGRIKEYEIATSIDGNEFTTVASGQWVDSKDIQYVEFIPTVANYIKITATEAYGGGAKQSCNIAEIGLFEYSDGVINVGDKAALTKLVNEVKDLDTSIYAKPTVDNLITAINEAQKLLDANLVSQQMLDNAYTKLINAKNALVNISKATNAIAKLDELKEEDYTPESWQIFINELTTLKEQLNDITSSREVLDIVVKADYIESQLIKAEITDTNKTVLKIAIDIASLISEESLENVIPVVVEEFKAALSEANDVYNNASATQEQVNNAFDRLASAMQKLEFYKGNKTALIEAIEEANSKQEEDYTADSWEALKKALQEANKVLADENAMQKEVDEATNKLQEALENLVTAVDKSLLQAFVEYVSGLNSSKYTETTWKTFETELTEANAVLKDTNATQEQVDNAYNQLVKAYLDLRLIPDKSLLEELINQAEGLNVANYTKASFDGLTKALNEAKVVYENPNATQKEVDNAKATLEKAINNLEVTPINNGDTTSVKTGDSSYITTSLGLIMTSGLIASYLKKKKKS